MTPDLPTAAPHSASEPLADDPWRDLRRATPARIGLGRVGDTLPLRPVLDFQLAHAEARDAVHAALDLPMLQDSLPSREIIVVRSAASERSEYLRRPDLGRKLDPSSEAELARHRCAPRDCVVVIADGLSALAATRHAGPLLEECLPRLARYSLAPFVVATQARVALGDAVGERLGARLCIMLIGGTSRS